VALSKLDAAAIQLEKSIELFLSKEYICSVTLSGAAEEILGELSKRAGIQNAVEFISTYRAPGEVTDPLTNESPKAIIGALNHARNSAKHAHFFDEEVAIDVGEALMLLMRAVPMAQKLGTKSKLFAILDAWIKDHPEVTRG
jgi:hypothetical protein